MVTQKALQEEGIDSVDVRDSVVNGVGWLEAQEQAQVAGLEVEVHGDNGRSTALRERHGKIQGDNGGPAAALAAEHRDHLPPRGGTRYRESPLASDALDGAREILLAHRPDEELLGPGPHGSQDRFGPLAVGTDEDRALRRRNQEPLDDSEPRIRWIAEIQDHDRRLQLVDKLVAGLRVCRLRLYPHALVVFEQFPKGVAARGIAIDNEQ